MVLVSKSTGSGWARSGHRRALVAGAVVFVIVLGGGAAAWAESSGGNSGYRTASVTRTNIGQSMTVVGTVEPVSDASASFQVAGQVATVTAAVGRQVTAGQPLGTLDTTALSESVSSAQSTVNADMAKLAQDESSQSSSSSQNQSNTASTTTTTAPHSGTSSTITQDQNTLTQDEAQTATDQQQEAADLAQAQKACGTSGTTTTTTTTPTNPSGCAAALAVVSKDQQQVSNDQTAVAKDEAALSQALSQGQSSTGSSGSGSPTGSGGSVGSGGSTGNSGSPSVPATAGSKVATEAAVVTPTGGGSGGSGTAGANASASSDTPEQIASDQADIDTARAQLTEAEQSLAEATLTSPINGTIVSVGITAGDTVSANSSTAVIVIIGTQSFEVTGTLSSAQVPSVKVGDTAGVQVDGVDDTLHGTVSQVGPVQSGDSGYTYPVVVVLPSSATGLFTGSTANVVISTGAVADVVAVPTSAVQALGTRTYVETLTDGELTRKVVKVGMVGDVYTQVLSGLTPGETVVLADYAEPVPSSNTATLGGFGGLGGGGGFGGGGFGGAGSFRSRIAGAGGGAGGFGNVNIAP